MNNDVSVWWFPTHCWVTKVMVVVRKAIKQTWLNLVNLEALVARAHMARDSCCNQESVVAREEHAVKVGEALAKRV